MQPNEGHTQSASLPSQGTPSGSTTLPDDPGTHIPITFYPFHPHLNVKLPIVPITTSPGTSPSSSPTPTTESSLVGNQSDLTSQPSAQSDGREDNQIGAIVGGTLGALTGIILLVALGFCIFRRRRARKEGQSPGGGTIEAWRDATNVTPFDLGASGIRDVPSNVHSSSPAKTKRAPLALDSGSAHAIETPRVAQTSWYHDIKIPGYINWSSPGWSESSLATETVLGEGVVEHNHNSERREKRWSVSKRFSGKRRGQSVHNESAPVERYISPLSP